MERIINRNNKKYDQNLPNFIVSVQNGWAKMSLKHANCILGSKANFYHMVKEEGFYLPSENSRCITTDYLFNVTNGSIFRILRKDVNFYTTIRNKWSKIDIVTWLETCAHLNVSLGFTIDKLPDYD